MLLEILRSYKTPKKNKIKEYKRILNDNNLVVVIRQRIRAETHYATIGRVWENNFGGGTSETHIMPNYEGKYGVFVVTKESYENTIKTCQKNKFVF